jgi:putative nucleotidyltransferase with HDIG domain
MSGASKQRGRQERIESLGIQKPRLVQWWENSDKAAAATRIGLAVLAAILLLVFCRTWQPTFAYRLGTIPARDLITRATFEVPNELETNTLRERRKREQLAFYSNRVEPLDQLLATLKDDLLLVLSAESFDELQKDQPVREAFSHFYKISETNPEGEPNEHFSMLKSVLVNDPDLTILEDDVLKVALRDNYKFGLIRALQHTPEQGNQERFRVYPVTNPEDVYPVEVSDVRVAESGTKIEKDLKERFRAKFPSENYEIVATMISDFIIERLADHETLTYNDELTETTRQAAAAAVEPVMTTYRSGESRLAEAGLLMSDTEIDLLRQEWRAMINNMHVVDKLARVAAYAGMIAALYLLCATYIFFVDDRGLLFDHVRLAKLLTIMVGAICLGYAASSDQWRGELVPLVLASIICAVVYGRELALLLMSAACVSLTLFLGSDLSQLVMMVAACFSCILLLGRIRSRTHLFFVGATSAAITVLTVVGVGIVTGNTMTPSSSVSDLEPLYRGPSFNVVVWELIKSAVWAGFSIMVSASIMTPLLPFVEKAFGVQTDLSLLELGDASHPLLRRLAQRAPGTYNHSINVASIAEAAADEIGANGLLVRVGAYFHDIGKMFKPEYFIENQSAGINQHDSLQPAMSTLVIIAHVKDGADLARSHHLPEPIVDFIMQHHGTTLVEYFYREAARRSEEDPNGEEVSDKDFRYPGPKPQTLEAAVMMLADTVESASRTLVDPTPSRIQNLVDSIAQKKMSDGQFDECGLTFRQLDRIRRSLVKSLTAIYHARVKYPGQQSA